MIARRQKVITIHDDPSPRESSNVIEFPYRSSGSSESRLYLDQAIDSTSGTSIALSPDSPASEHDVAPLLDQDIRRIEEIVDRSNLESKVEMMDRFAAMESKLIESQGRLNDQISGLRQDLTSTQGDIKGEISALRVTTKDEITAFRIETTREISSLRERLSAIETRVTIVGTLIAGAIALSGVLIAFVG